ncbi:MAG: DNA phosphorothioation-associated putative methyltransferase [Xenococcaceae cyanobacterium]
MVYCVEGFQEIANSCQNSSVGKLLPNALYVHMQAVNALTKQLQDYERQAREIEIESQMPIERATLVKFNLDRAKISYLFYPDFDTNPHPELHYSIIVDLQTERVNYRDYRNSDNPPILHRKETFVTSDYHLYDRFCELTNVEVALGLLEESRYIGTRQEWELRLLQNGISFEGHSLICPIDRGVKEKKGIRIDRHKAAIVRKELSRPVRLAIEANLFASETTFFDYGCGYGGDVKRIGDRGYVSSGWDPYYSPDTPLVEADIVNLGYIINVIEDTAERREALVKAWELTSEVLIVAAQVLVESRHRGLVAYGDGVITSRNTFQKYYQQEELKVYIDQVLNVDAIPIDLGVYFIFRDEAKAEAFEMSRVRSRVYTPKVRIEVKNFEEYADLLQPLMSFFSDRGRLPIKGELPQEEAIKAEFRNYKTAFNLILQATDAKDWEAIAEKRRQDLKLYLALASFNRRPTPRKLSSLMRFDLKALFGSYKEACQCADRMLYGMGDLNQIKRLCLDSSIGKILPNSLLIHVSALENLDPLLRLYESCASHTLGRLEDANLIKLSFKKPKIAYWFCADFDREPHPIIRTSMEVDLRDLQVNYRDFDLDDNPPILHEKDILVAPDYHLYEKFARLTKQEREWGLLDDFKAISHWYGWQQCLKEHCATYRGDRLVWRKDCDSYKVKLLKSQINARKKEGNRQNQQ